MNYSEISFILKGKRRKSILFSLEKGVKTSSNLSKELKLNLANVSNTLKELEKNEFIECKNPEDYHLKFYELTEKGKQVLDEIKKLEQDN